MTVKLVLLSDLHSPYGAKQLLHRGVSHFVRKANTGIARRKKSFIDFKAAWYNCTSCYLSNWHDWILATALWHCSGNIQLLQSSDLCYFIRGRQQLPQTNKRTKPETSPCYCQIQCCFKNNVNVIANKSRLGEAGNILPSDICRTWLESSPEWSSSGAMTPEQTYCKLHSLLTEALRTSYNGFALL